MPIVRGAARMRLFRRMKESNITRRLRISGRVQGVGFRYHFMRAARECGIGGWVRNRSDGSVEAMVSGTPDAVDKITAWARQGPPHAAVTAMEVEAASGSFSTFETLPTE